jgi:hypothetical protein
MKYAEHNPSIPINEYGYHAVTDPYSESVFLFAAWGVNPAIPSHLNYPDMTKIYRIDNMLEAPTTIFYTTGRIRWVQPMVHENYLFAIQYNENYYRYWRITDQVVNSQSIGIYGKIEMPTVCTYPIHFKT